MFKGKVCYVRRVCSGRAKTLQRAGQSLVADGEKSCSERQKTDIFIAWILYHKRQCDTKVHHKRAKCKDFHKIYVKKTRVSSRHPRLHLCLIKILFYNDRFVLWYECLHDAPTDKICYGTDAEYYHVSSRLAIETEECESLALLGSPCEELTRSFVDGK